MLRCNVGGRRAARGEMPEGEVPQYAIACPDRDRLWRTITSGDRDAGQYPGFCSSSGFVCICVCGIGMSTLYAGTGAGSL